MTPLAYVGAAYAVVWILIFVYAWRLTSASRKLAEKLEELERDAAAGSKR
jgi:CcmD family protein